MKVYLKFNKTDSVGYMCLLSWLEIFHDYEIILVCDIFKVDSEPTPLFLDSVLKRTNKHIEIINTDYLLSEPFNDLIHDPRYQKAAAANLTCHKHNTTDQIYWLVDADDTMVLSRNFDFVKKKFSEAENHFISNNLDSLALDFYRMQNDTWSFGICLMRSTLNFDYIRDKLSDKDFVPKDTRCLDICFDKLRRKDLLKLKTFIINDLSFIHYVHKTKNLPYYLYHWNNSKLNGISVPEDFIIL